MPEIKENFFWATKPAQEPYMIQWNDPEFRARYGKWISDNFDALVSEYKEHGRWLALSEFEDSIL